MNIDLFLDNYIDFSSFESDFYNQLIQGTDN